MRAVNLLPRDDVRKARKTPHPAILVGAAGGLVVAVALFALSTSAAGELDAKRSEVQNLQVQIDVLPPPPPPQSAADAQLASQRTERAAALASALSRRVAWDRVLRRFSLVLPEDVWLTTLAVTSPTLATTPAGAPAKPPGSAPSGLTMNGYTYTHEAVARLLSRLSVIPDLTNVQLQSSSLSKVQGRDIVQFTIAADIRTGSVPS